MNSSAIRYAVGVVLPAFMAVTMKDCHEIRE